MLRKSLQLAWIPGVASVVLTFVAIYCSWAVAYVQPRRPPRPSLDDPDAIGGLATDVYSFCVWMVGGLAAVWAASTLVTIVTGVLSKTGDRGAGWLGLASVTGFFLLLVGSYLQINAIAWFLD